MKTIKSIFLLIALSVVCIPASMAQGLKAFKLKNGLTVFI